MAEFRWFVGIDWATEVHQVAMTTPVVDVHTHIFPPEFGAMCISGIDDLLTYHYLIAEMFRSANVSYACFWRMNKSERADLVCRSMCDFDRRGVFVQITDQGRARLLAARPTHRAVLEAVFDRAAELRKKSIPPKE